MDNNTHVSSYDDFLKELKNRVGIMKNRCSKAQEKLERIVSEISSLDKDIGQNERELSEYRYKTKTVNESWKEGEIEIERLKWMREKALVILECNRRKNGLQSKTMNIIKQNYSNLTTCAFKTVRQEAVRKIITREINNLADRKKELENQLRRLQKTKTVNENHLNEARTELAAIKARGEAVFRLEQKLRESEALKFSAITKLNDIKISRFFNLENYESSRVVQKVE